MAQASVALPQPGCVSNNPCWRAEENEYGSRFLQPTARRSRASRLPFDEGPLQPGAPAEAQAGRSGQVIARLPNWNKGGGRGECVTIVCLRWGTCAGGSFKG